MEQKAQELAGNFSALLPLIVSHALNGIGALVILLIGLWLSGKADALAVRMLGRTPHFDPMLKSFFGSVARYLILIVTVLAVLSQFGIQTTSLIAVLGAASLAIGLALQGTLSNLAAGIMLLIFRPFRTGHKVQIGGNLGRSGRYRCSGPNSSATTRCKSSSRMAASGANRCATTVSILHRLISANCGSGFPMTRRLSQPSRGCALSSRPNRGS